MEPSTFPLIELSGSPYERGVTYGKAVPEARKPWVERTFHPYSLS